MGAARTLFERALQLDAANFEALSGLVAVDVADNKRPAARARVESELAKRPDDGRLLMLAATIEIADGQLPGGSGAAEGDQRRSEQPGGVFDARTDVGHAAQDAAGARTVRADDVQKDPNAIGARTMTAILFEIENNREEARKRYEQILAIDSRAAVAANNLAQFHVDTGGNLDVALQLAQTAKAQLPDMPEVNDTLAWIYYKKDLPRLAVPLLEEAVAKDPNRALYHAHLGLAYAKAGDEAKAKASLTHALKLEPNMPEAAEARKILGAS